MDLPLWAVKIVSDAIEGLRPIEHGKVFLQVEFSYSNGGLGSAKTKVSSEECHRPPGEKVRK